MAVAVELKAEAKARAKAKSYVFYSTMQSRLLHATTSDTMTEPCGKPLAHRYDEELETNSLIGTICL